MSCSRVRDQYELVQVDYYLSNAVPETPLWECARVAKAEHRIEECMQRSKSEAGLADYEVRNWTGCLHANSATGKCDITGSSALNRGGLGVHRK